MLSLEEGSASYAQTRSVRFAHYISSCTSLHLHKPNGYILDALQIGTGARMKALSTQGGTGMRDNIANVFGPRTVEALTPLEAPLGDLAHASGYVNSP